MQIGLLIIPIRHSCCSHSHSLSGDTWGRRTESSNTIRYWDETKLKWNILALHSKKAQWLHSKIKHLTFIFIWEDECLFITFIQLYNVQCSKPWLGHGGNPCPNQESNPGFLANTWTTVQLEKKIYFIKDQGLPSISTFIEISDFNLRWLLNDYGIRTVTEMAKLEQIIL